MLLLYFFVAVRSLVLCLLFAGFCVAIPDIREDGSPVVEVPQGTIVGIAESYSEADVYAFRSIPFAKPPVDELRFMAPVPSDPWEGELNATKIPPMCNQLILLGQEDCLYLNVYTPTNTTETTPLPVMVFIYGGAFYLGDTRLYDRVNKLIKHDVIVAMMNYRVGVLGFFSTGDSVAPGNQGLMDQTLALKWIKENIEYFGGDSDRITIFGESAGSASVHYQILAPSARGLYNQAILESGTSLSPWAAGREFERVSLELAEKFRCDTSSSEEIVSCLQNKLAFRISNSYLDFAEFNLQPVFFAPRVDGVYLPDQPARLLRDGNFSKIPIMIGTNREDGSLMSGEMLSVPRTIEALNGNFSALGPITLELYDDEDPITTATAVYNYYLEKTQVTMEDANNFTVLCTDRFFGHPTDWVVQYHSALADVYLYELDHRPRTGLSNIFVLGGVEEARNWVSHTDELQYIFDFVPGREHVLEEDLQIGDMMSKMWTDFAKTGNPTPDTEALGFQWTPVTSDSTDHLSIDVPPTMQPDGRTSRRAFWETLPLRINNYFNEA